MKKTLTINLSGVIFHIDEDAYQLLSQYLEKLRKHFSPSDGCEEILSDIESRIAEILQEKLTGSRQVITIEDIGEVIKMMGEPNQIGDHSDQQEAKKEEEGSKGAKRFYRNPDQKMIAGVCSGLGAYFHIDPILIRFIFIVSLFAGGAGFIIYLLLWIFIPEAASTAEKLEMRGEKVTIGNIERSIREELKGLSQRLGKMANGTQENLKKGVKATRPVFQTLVDIFVSLVKVLFRIILFATGIILVLIGLMLLIAIIALTFGWGGGYPFDQEITVLAFPWMLDLMLGHDIDTFFIRIIFLLLLGIPSIMLVYNGLRLLFRFRRIHHLGLTVFNIWLVALIAATYIGFRVFNLYENEANDTREIRMAVPLSDTLYITMPLDQPANQYLKDDPYAIIGDQIAVFPKDKGMFLYPKIRFIMSNDSLFHIRKILTSRGRSRSEALHRINQMDFSACSSNDSLYISPLAGIPQHENWRGQEVRIEIEVPSGKYVRFLNGLWSIYWYDYFKTGAEPERTYRMTEDGMQEYPQK